MKLIEKYFPKLTNEQYALRLTMSDVDVPDVQAARTKAPAVKNSIIRNAINAFKSQDGTMFFNGLGMFSDMLGLKKLIATCYVTSPIMYTQLSLFDETPAITEGIDRAKPYRVEITEVNDENGDGAVDMTDVEILIRNKKNVLTLLEGDGDFRSQECIELLKQADVVVTIIWSSYQAIQNVQNEESQSIAA